MWLPKEAVVYSRVRKNKNNEGQKIKVMEVKFSIEEIVGDIITYDVVKEENGVKTIIAENVEDLDAAERIKDLFFKVSQVKDYTLFG